MRRNRIHPFVLLILSMMLGVVISSIIAGFAYKAPSGDPDGDIEFVYLIIGIFGGGFVGLIAGIFVNIFMSNRDADQNSILSLGRGHPVDSSRAASNNSFNRSAHSVAFMRET